MIEEIKMEYKQFGKTGERVFVIGLGTYGYGDAYGDIRSEESFDVLNSVISSMPNYANLLIDTAPYYSARMCEWLIGEFFAESDSNNVLIATKSGRHIEADRISEKDFSFEFLKADLDRLGNPVSSKPKLLSPSQEHRSISEARLQFLQEVFPFWTLCTGQDCVYPELCC